MLFSSWLRNCKSSLQRRAAQSQTRQRKPLVRRFASQLRLEVLEDRVVPASLSYSTFLDGSVYASAVDSQGNIYVTGQAGSGFQATPGAFQTSGSGTFVAKLNPSGTAVLYATYLGNGGGAGGFGTGIAVDGAGDAYVIGDSTGVPTTANAIASSGSGQDFVAELNPTGSGLLYSTYLPGTVNYNFSFGTLGFSGAIAVDSSGNIDVAGAAGVGLPVTAGAFQSAYAGGTGGYNAFFTKINPTLSASASLLYSTYLGGGSDQASGIAVDAAGNAYVTGFTGSGNFPTTKGAFQSTSGGKYDIFVTKLNPALSGAASLVYSTYLGGSSTDGYSGAYYAIENPQINGGIAVDSAGNAYVTGTTASVNFPTTPGAFQVKSSFSQSRRLLTAPCDAFVTKLNATGTALIYSTYLGSGTTSQNSGTGIAVDANGDAYLSGWTNATVFPTKNPLQATNRGGYNAFVSVFNPSGSSLLFSTYLGGSGNDFAFGIGLDSAGNAYVAGEATSSDFPTTAGAYQTTPGSGFALKIDPPVEGSTAMPAIASIPSGTAASSRQATTNNGSPQVQRNNISPAPSQADLLFTLIGNNPGFSASPSVLSSLLSEWQSLESALLTRFDALLSMGLNADKLIADPDILMRDLLFASLSESIGV